MSAVPTGSDQPDDSCRAEIVSYEAFTAASDCAVEPIEILKIQKQRCAHPIYGQGGCTATDPQQCVHTIRTCKSPCDFLCENADDYHTSCNTKQLTSVADAYVPDIRSARQEPGKVELCKAMPSSGTVTIQMQDSPTCDYQDDPYRDQRGHTGEYSPGSRLEKYLQRNILEGRRIDYGRGNCGTDYPADFLNSVYFIDSIDGPSNDCVYTLRAKDALAFFTQSKPQYPRPTSTVLRNQINPDTTQIIIDPIEFPQNVRAICVNDETLRVEYSRTAYPPESTIPLDVFFIMGRAICGSQMPEQPHPAGEERVQVAGYFPEGWRVGDVMAELFHQGGEGLPTIDQFCDCGPFAECVLDAKQMRQISEGCGRFDTVCETAICEPTDIDQLLSELLPFGYRAYFDPCDAKIRAHRYAPPACNEQIAHYSPCDIIDCELQVKTKRTERVSEVQLLTHPRDCTKTGEDNYARLSISKDRSTLGNACGNPEWQSPRVKEMSSRFINECNAYQATLAVNRLLHIRRNAPREIIFRVHAKHRRVSETDWMTVEHEKLQNWDGSPSTEIYFVNQVALVEDNCWRITAESSGFRTTDNWVSETGCGECGLIQNENRTCGNTCPMVW